MAKSKTEKTKKPTGLSLKRSGNTFTLSWKIGDKDYGDGQYFQYLINDTGKDSWLPKKNTDIGKKATSKSIKINKENFYPYKKKGVDKPRLYEIGMRVKGNRKKYTTGSGKNKKNHNPGASDWAVKKYTINPPRKPSLSVALDEELTNVCVFSWSTTYASDDSYIFTDVQWQTVLKKNCSETDGSKISWKGAESGSAGASSSKTITEDTAILYKNNASYTRWFRVRSRGPRGASDWVYKKHVYALPNKASSVSATAKETTEGGFQCVVTWTAGQSNHQKPIDKTTVQYSITIPDEKLSCPNGASWTDANISKDTAYGDAAVFSIDDQLSKDQCLFIRVNTQHDSYTTYGKPVLASVGYLKDPTGLSVQTDNVTHKAIVTATNASDIEDSVLVVRYVPATGDSINCGIIPHGSSSVTVTCPNWDSQTAIKFEVYAMVGSYAKQTRTDGVDSYSITAKMRSEHTIADGGEVPVAPQNVSVSRVEGKSDTIQVIWDWPWSAAGSAELSWSDHDDAWESTDEPETYLVNNLHASKWHISGLETGKTWYVRVRLIKGNADDSENVTYGPWSSIDQGMIDLSSAPNKPSLSLADPIIPQDGATTASWVYTATDNTEQAYAEVAVIYDIYAKTTDLDVVLGKDYYTVVGTSVGSPVAENLNLYYELSSGTYVKTQDTEIVSGKTYYTLVGTRVESPVTASIGSYYEITDQLYNPIAHALTTQHVTVDAETAGFSVGNIYNLACRVKSESGRLSEWSDIVSITVAEPLVCTVTQTSLTEQTETKTYTDPVTGEEVTVTRTYLALTELPFTATATGAGAGGITSMTIRRAESYYLERPDESDFTGHKDEVISTKTQLGEGQMAFDVDDLIGSLDDGASYTLVISIKDGLGQSAQQAVPFEVHWSHQAVIPSATVVIDDQDLIAQITPVADDDVLFYYELTTDTELVAGKTYYTRSGSGTEQDPYVYTAVQSPSAASLSTYYEKLSYGDVADIYRLSIDKPELIVQGAEFGQTYVDPYPALGDMGGYRVVFRTKNGDYITPDNEIAKVDSPELGVNPIENEEQLNVIDFEGRQIRFYYNTDYSYSWAKDFQESQYMGGSIQGDWNAAVSRTGTLSSLAITVLDQEMLQVVRRLAEHPGICHVRTADGSSYAADVQVSEDRVHTDQEMVVNYSLTITRVDSQGFDGMTIEQYIAETQEPEEEE